MFEIHFWNSVYLFNDPQCPKNFPLNLLGLIIIEFLKVVLEEIEFPFFTHETKIPKVVQIGNFQKGGAFTNYTPLIILSSGSPVCLRTAKSPVLHLCCERLLVINHRRNKTKGCPDRSSLLLLTSCPFGPVIISEPNTMGSIPRQVLPASCWLRHSLQGQHF